MTLTEQNENNAQVIRETIFRVQKLYNECNDKELKISFGEKMSGKSGTRRYKPMQNYYYTIKELEKILKNLVVLIDSRERENSHITDYLDNQSINYKSQKLDFGDYSCMIPALPEMGIMRDVTFKNSIIIERKGTLEELSGNLTHRRNEFESELLRAKGSRIYLLIENGTYSDILLHKYSTQYHPKSFIATLKTFEIRYGISCNFISSSCSGNFIYYTCLYYLREYLKCGEY